MAKKSLFIIFWGLISFNNLNAQNLEKNLKLVGLVSRDTAISIVGNKTLLFQVPNDKVWKLEDFTIVYTYGEFENACAFTRIQINESVIQSGNVYNYNLDRPNFWLNNGDLLTIKANNICSGGNTILNLRFSAFEYTIE